MPLVILALTGCVSGHAPSAGSTHGAAGFDSGAGGVDSIRLAGGLAAFAGFGAGASGIVTGVVPGIGSHGSVAGPDGVAVRGERRSSTDFTAVAAVPTNSPNAMPRRKERRITSQTLVRRHVDVCCIVGHPCW